MKIKDLLNYTYYIAILMIAVALAVEGQQPIVHNTDYNGSTNSDVVYVEMHYRWIEDTNVISTNDFQTNPYLAIRSELVTNWTQTFDLSWFTEKPLFIPYSYGLVDSNTVADLIYNGKTNSTTLLESVPLYWIRELYHDEITTNRIIDCYETSTNADFWPASLPQ
jgi:hypothetical protein